jgi:transcriptional regulator with XRE-family HTH domain
MRHIRKRSFDEWLQRSLVEDPDLAERVKKRLAEMRIEQDLVALRQSRGLSQAQLGRMLGISQPAVARMETAGGNLEIRTLVRAAEVLEARLEVRLISVSGRSRVRDGRPYASGSVAPSLVQEFAREYGAAARRKPARPFSAKKKR